MDTFSLFIHTEDLIEAARPLHTSAVDVPAVTAHDMKTTGVVALPTSPE
jgi:hypothetical protein